MAGRRYDMDWLRVVAILAVFVFHSTRFLYAGGYHINAKLRFVLFVFDRSFILPWFMELFFLISGLGAWYALRSRSAAVFLRGRAKRLLIPLYTVGLFILLPPQFYFDRVQNEGYAGGFWHSIPRYFERWGPPRLTASPLSIFHLPHDGQMWFIEFLFLISLLGLPFLLFLTSGRGARWIDGAARLCGRRGGILLFILPLALTSIVLGRVFRVDLGWAEFIWFAIYFLVGFMIPADPRFTDAFRRNGLVGFGLWLAGCVGGVAVQLLFLDHIPAPMSEPFSLPYAAFQLFWVLASWGSVVFLVSVGARYLNFNNRLLAYATEAILPFYLLHVTVIRAVGYYVVPWNVGIGPTFLVIAVVSFAVTMAIYEFGVRRFGPVRFLFGMRGLAMTPRMQRDDAE